MSNKNLLFDPFPCPPENSDPSLLGGDSYLRRLKDIQLQLEKLHFYSHNLNLTSIEQLCFVQLLNRVDFLICNDVTHKIPCLDISPEADQPFCPFCELAQLDKINSPYACKCEVIK